MHGPLPFVWAMHAPCRGVLRYHVSPALLTWLQLGAPICPYMLTASYTLTGWKYISSIVELISGDKPLKIVDIASEEQFQVRVENDYVSTRR